LEAQFGVLKRFTLAIATILAMSRGTAASKLISVPTPQTQKPLPSTKPNPLI